MSAADKQTVDTQAQQRQIKVWVYNSQNATPDVQRVNQLARAAHIPITTITETLSPASATFEQWQVAELQQPPAGASPGDRQMSARRRTIDAAPVRRGRDRSEPARPVGAGGAAARARRLGSAGSTVWSDVSFAIAAGEFAAILGPNGSGKTTLLRVLLGELALDARHARRCSVARRVRRSGQIGYLPQRRHFDASITDPRHRPRQARARRRALGTAAAPLRARAGRGGDRAGRRRRVREPPDRPAVGRRAAAAADRAGAVSRPQLLILDEPLDSLDLPNQTAVAALLARICRQQGVTVLLVAHDVNPLLTYLDRVVYFGAGHAAVGTPREVITAETLSRLYGVPIEVLQTADGRLVVVGLPEAPAHHSDRHEHDHG